MKRSKKDKHSVYVGEGGDPAPVKLREKKAGAPDPKTDKRRESAVKRCIHLIFCPPIDFEGL